MARLSTQKDLPWEYPEALDGFILVVDMEGDMVYLSESVARYLGLTQVCVRMHVIEIHTKVIPKCK